MSRRRNSTGEFRRRRTESSHTLIQAVLGSSANLLDAASLEELCSAALQVAVDMLDLDQCRIAVRTPGGSSLVQYSVDSDRAQLTHPKLAGGLTREALRCGELELLERDALTRHADPETDAPFLAPSIHATIVTPLMGAGGRPLGALVAARSGEDRFRAHEMTSMKLFAWHVGSAVELHHARHELRHWNAVVESSLTAIIGKTLDGHITHWNPAAERLYGYSKEEAIGSHIGLVVPDDRREEQEQCLASVRAGHRVSELETYRVTKAGRRVEVSLTISPIRDASGSVVGASAINRDITNEKRQRKLFRQSVESAPSAIIAVRAVDGSISLANREAERLFGYSRSELQGAKVEMLLPHELRATHERHRQAFDEHPEERRMGTGRELWAVGKKGRKIPVEVGLNPVEVGGERLVLASIVDISARKRRDDERQLLLQRAQDAVSARDTFLSVASHELKTPLTALQLTTQGLLRAATRAEVLDTERVLHKLEGINRQSRRLGTLIDQLLDVSRITAGRLQLDPAETDLDDLLRQVVERYSHLPDAPPIHLASARAHRGWWDAGRLDQVFTNLIGNAIKYGEGKPIDITIDDLGSRVCVSVQDQGPGIEPSDQARIFERFERLVSHRHLGGFGLGLWIARQLVNAHHGQIEVMSAHGRGSTFRVILPKTDPPASGTTESRSLP